MAQTRCTLETRDGKFFIVLCSGPFPTKDEANVFAEWLRQSLLTATDQEYALGERLDN